MYSDRVYVIAGGLMSYGPNFADRFGEPPATWTIRGAKPADLPSSSRPSTNWWSI